MKVHWHEQEMCLQGIMCYTDADLVYKSGLSLIQQQAHFPIVVNLQGIQQENTLVLAVLIQWLKQTPHVAGLHFKGVSEKMMKIIQASHLEHDLIFVK